MNFDEIACFTAFDEFGYEVEYEVLLNFELEDTGKSYLVYRGVEDEEGEPVQVSSYDPTLDQLDLQEVTDELELQMISSVLDEYLG